MEQYKKPLTIKQQVKCLEQNKKVTYNNIIKERAEEILLLHNYINVISPFKYCFYKTDSHNLPIKNPDKKHIYVRNVEFSEYFEKYINERSKYPSLYSALSIFESAFNSIVSNIIITSYHLNSEKHFDDFIQSLSANINNLEKETSNSKKHMLKNIDSFKIEASKYNNFFIFMDRLSLTELVTIYKSCNPSISSSIFKIMFSYDLTLGFIKKSDFDRSLSKIIQIRNCVMHGNSLTILVRYYNVKTKSFRKDSDRKSYTNIIKKLLLFYTCHKNYYAF